MAKILNMGSRVCRPQREDLSGTDMYHNAKFHGNWCHHHQDICNRTEKSKCVSKTQTCHTWVPLKQQQQRAYRHNVYGVYTEMRMPTFVSRFVDHLLCSFRRLWWLNFCQLRLNFPQSSGVDNSFVKALVKLLLQQLDVLLHVSVSCQQLPD